MPYAIMVYNNSIHFSTKEKAIDIIWGHLDTKHQFAIYLNAPLYNNYIKEQKKLTKKRYQHLNLKTHSHKERIISKLNENREKPKTYNNAHANYRTRNVVARNKVVPKLFKQILYNKIINNIIKAEYLLLLIKTQLYITNTVKNNIKLYVSF